jgi:hypothetical protein
MPKPNVIVGAVTRVDRPAGAAPFAATGAATVHFDSAAVAKIGPASAASSRFAPVIDELSRMIMPAYVEVDPASREITRLLIPLVVTVTDLRADPKGNVQVDLEISHGTHVLRAGTPDYDEILKTLRAAREQGTVVTVTENENHEIIDARPSPHAGRPPARPLTRARPAPFDQPAATVSPDRAAELFAQMAGQTCDPSSVPAPCIPFMYPDDGCWGRAHQMCRLMIAAGTQPSKVWIYGTLKVRTRNNPNCSVSWGWHVAPTLQVASNGGGADTMVIDPSMFTEPVAVTSWSGAQNDPNAVLAQTDASAFYRAPDGGIEVDLDYSQTAQVLARYRLRLKLRSQSEVGPPPYANCDAVA